MILPRRFAPALFVFLWSTGFIGARYAMPWAEPFWFLAVRFALASAGLAALALALGRPMHMPPRLAGGSMLVGTLIHGLYLGGAFWAIHHGMPAGFVALVVGLQPLVTTLIAAPVLGETVGIRHWAGMSTGLVGVAMVVWPKLGAGAGVTPTLLTVTFLAVLAISAGTVVQKWLPRGGDLLIGTAWQYVGAALLMFVFALVGETGTYTLNGELVFAMAWLVVVLSIGAIMLLMLMIRDGAVSSVSSLFYLVPAVTAAMAWALFGESLNLWQIAGMGVTAVGVALAGRQLPTRARASR